MIDLKELQGIAKDLTMLIVEDDQLIREFMSKYFNIFFSTIISANDGEEGLAKYKKSHFDIVITDINMPKISGLKMSKEIKKINKNQEIIIVSAYADSKFFIESIKIGVSGYILKPIEYEQLNSIIYKSAFKIREFKEIDKYRHRLEEMVEQKTKTIKKQYITDSLTGLYNRYALLEKLKILKDISLTIMQIHDFGTINKIYGLRYSDILLKKIANMLKDNIKDNALLFRLKSNEFVIIQHNKAKIAQLLAIKINVFFSKNPININGIDRIISFKVGISHGNGNTILKEAILALEEAEYLGNGVNANIYHRNSIYEITQQEQLKWIEIINESIKDDLFIPFYQPIINNKSKKIEKYECLARLRKDGKIISPYKFIEPLRMSKNLSFLTKSMITKSFKYMSQNNFDFSINITEQDLFEEYLLEFLKKYLFIYQINPKRVIIEILESITISDDKKFIKEIKNLKDLGLKIAIDDFGTQSSNFSRLLDMDVDFIKIDGSFIKNLDTDKRAKVIVKTIVNFAKSINAQMVAEFVHQKNIQKEVEKLGIEFSQGYFFGTPQEFVIESEECNRETNN